MVSDVVVIDDDVHPAAAAAAAAIAAQHSGRCSAPAKPAKPACEPQVCTVCVEGLHNASGLASSPAELQQELRKAGFDDSFVRRASQLCILPKCQHIFHSHCVLPYLMRYKRECPNCRCAVEFERPKSPSVVFLPDGLFQVTIVPDTKSPTSALASASTDPASKKPRIDPTALLRRDLAGKQELIDEMQDELDQLQFELEGMQDGHGSAVLELSRLQATHAIVCRERTTAMSRVIKLESDVAAMAAKMTALEEASASAKTTVALLAAAVEKKEVELETVQRKLLAYSALDALDGRPINDTEWNGKLQDIKSIDKIEDLREVLVEYHGKIRAFYDLSKRSRQRALEMRDKLEKSRNEAADLRSKVAELEAQCKTAQTALGDLQREQQSSGARRQSSIDVSLDKGSNAISSHRFTRQSEATVARNGLAAAGRLGDRHSTTADHKRLHQPSSAIFDLDEPLHLGRDRASEAVLSRAAFGGDALAGICRPGSMGGTKRIRGAKDDGSGNGGGGGGGGTSASRSAGPWSKAVIVGGFGRTPDGMGGSRSMAEHRPALVDALAPQPTAAAAALTLAASASARASASAGSAGRAKPRSSAAAALVAGLSGSRSIEAFLVRQ